MDGMHISEPAQQGGHVVSPECTQGLKYPAPRHQVGLCSSTLAERTSLELGRVMIDYPSILEECREDNPPITEIILPRTLGCSGLGQSQGVTALVCHVSHLPERYQV